MTMSQVEALFPADAPAPVAPLSPAVRWGELIFVSGQVPRDVHGVITEGGVAEQTRTVLDNIRLILEGCGSSLQSVVKTTVFLTRISDMAEMNAVYAEVFGEHRPARSTVEISALGKPEFLVEIEAIAVSSTNP
ncbi:endoribonuclease L-PSP [Micromonospora viridifaciens]|uniref:Endoribonuclease L-PSP n=1 Tax=Micromonospora viridifaciens TaxID=1881 RepID=A0A1C4X0M5_MICVI|nr:RidA family protein [Micromonospora viridifaciens]SCF01651.1 endoribonuclease L-PSP [Micromonospora viridifaciens]